MGARQEWFTETNFTKGLIKASVFCWYPEAHRHLPPSSSETNVTIDLRNVGDATY